MGSSELGYDVHLRLVATDLSAAASNWRSLSCTRLPFGGVTHMHVHIYFASIRFYSLFGWTVHSPERRRYTSTHPLSRRSTQPLGLPSGRSPLDEERGSVTRRPFPATGKQSLTEKRPSSKSGILKLGKQFQSKKLGNFYTRPKTKNEEGERCEQWAQPYAHKQELISTCGKVPCEELPPEMHRGGEKLAIRM